MTVHKTIQLVREYYRPRLTFRERNFIDKMLDGLSGMGDLDDEQVKNYITEKQIKFARDIGKRFHIKETTKL